MYKDENDGNVTPWLSHLYPEYMNEDDVLRCDADVHQKKTAATSWLGRPDGEFSETYDRPGNTGVSMDPTGIEFISYFYEMSDADCSWGSWGGVSGTWGQVKEAQLKDRDGDGNTGDPYNPVEFPVVRCLWHVEDVKSLVKGSAIGKANIPVLNIAYGGNVWESYPEWEDGPLD